MHRITDGVWVLATGPRGLGVNAYVLDGGLVVDARLRAQAGATVRALRDAPVPLTAHVLTHAHPDHNGATAAICRTFGLPLAVGARDAGAARSGRTAPAAFPRPLGALSDRLVGGPGHPVDRELADGDELPGGWRVLETPGHTAGHIALWREADGVLVAGDVVFHLGLPGRRFVTAPGLVADSTADNRASLRRVAGLAPRTTVFGHGAPLRDPAPLQAFAAAG